MTAHRTKVKKRQRIAARRRMIVNWTLPARVRIRNRLKTETTEAGGSGVSHILHSLVPLPGVEPGEVPIGSKSVVVEAIATVARQWLSLGREVPGQGVASDSDAVHV